MTSFFSRRRAARLERRVYAHAQTLRLGCMEDCERSTDGEQTESNDIESSWKRESPMPSLCCSAPLLEASVLEHILVAQSEQLHLDL